MIRDQIKSDISTLETFIQKLRTPNFSIYFNNKWIYGDQLEQMITHKEKEVQQLKALLSSRVVPETYLSRITQKTYARSPEEERLSRNLPNSLFYTFCKKESRKAPFGPHRSRFFLEHDDGSLIVMFSMEHLQNKAYPEGGFSQKIKKGFIEPISKPRYAVKIFKNNLFQRDSKQLLRMAMRASYCAQLLGRTGLAFLHHGKHYFVTDWHPGISLYDADPNDITAISIEQRIKLTLDLIRQIAILHQKGLMHCDIKPHNVIMSAHSINLIDFDGVRSKGEPPLHALPHTPEFLDSQFHWNLRYNTHNAYKFFDEKSELYALGLTLAFLFPDLLAPAYSKRTVNFNGASSEIFEYESVIFHYGRSYQQHKALADLICQLSSQERQLRPALVASVFDRLYDLYKNKYKQSYDFRPDPIDTKPEQSGKEVFEAIEGELLEFNHRMLIWKKSLVADTEQSRTPWRWRTVSL